MPEKQSNFDFESLPPEAARRQESAENLLRDEFLYESMNYGQRTEYIKKSKEEKERLYQEWKKNRAK